MRAHLERSRWLLRFRGDGEGERLLGERLHRQSSFKRDKSEELLLYSSCMAVADLLHLTQGHQYMRGVDVGRVRGLRLARMHVRVVTQASPQALSQHTFTYTYTFRCLSSGPAWLTGLLAYGWMDSTQGTG